MVDHFLVSHPKVSKDSRFWPWLPAGPLENFGASTPFVTADGHHEWKQRLTFRQSAGLRLGTSWWVANFHQNVGHVKQKYCYSWWIVRIYNGGSTNKRGSRMGVHQNEIHALTPFAMYIHISSYIQRSSSTMRINGSSGVFQDKPKPKVQEATWGCTWSCYWVIILYNDINISLRYIYIYNMYKYIYIYNIYIYIIYIYTPTSGTAPPIIGYEPV